MKGSIFKNSMWKAESEVLNYTISGGSALTSMLDVSLIFMNPIIYPQFFTDERVIYINQTYPLVGSTQITSLVTSSQAKLLFSFDSQSYSSYMYEAESFVSTLQKIGAILALFKLGMLLEPCHQS